MVMLYSKYRLTICLVLCRWLSLIEVIERNQWTVRVNDCALQHSNTHFVMLKIRDQDIIFNVPEVENFTMILADFLRIKRAQFCELIDTIFQPFVNLPKTPRAILVELS